MKATDLLEEQHRKVERLFKKFEAARSDAEKIKIFDEIAANLVAHDAIERELFYPTCERELSGDKNVLGESLVEHGLVEFCIFRADKNRNASKLASYVKVLKDVVAHHVEEEEHELLPKADKQLSRMLLESLGAKMERRFAESMATDFRKPLRDNLQQVLAGRAKTVKPKRVAAKTRAASVKRARTTRTPRKRTTTRRAAR